jgi:hypothetical protein
LKLVVAAAAAQQADRGEDREQFLARLQRIQEILRWLGEQYELSGFSVKRRQILILKLPSRTLSPVPAW